MKKFPLYIAYGGGAFALLGVSFLLFAALSGTPMSELPAVGGFFPPPEPAETAQAESVPSDARDELDTDRRSSGQVVEGARSPLQAFLLPSPFSAGELEQLEERLENRIRELELRERELARAEAELEEEREHYRRLFAELEEIRTELVREDRERRAREVELARDRDALEETERASYGSLAKIYAEGKARDMAAMLTATYSAEKAAWILAALPDDRAAGLLAEIHEADPAAGAAYVDAYRRALAQPSDSK